MVTSVVGVVCVAGGVAIGSTVASSPSGSGSEVSKDASDVSEAAKIAKHAEQQVLEIRHVHAEVVCAVLPGREITKCFATTQSKKPPFETIVTPFKINHTRNGEWGGVGE